jgi:hypothetical protein
MSTDPEGVAVNAATGCRSQPVGQDTHTMLLLHALRQLLAVLHRAGLYDGDELGRTARGHSLDLLQQWQGRLRRCGDGTRLQRPSKRQRR